MYWISGRERIGRGRYSRYIVTFTTTWPRGARSIYLVSTFTSFYPGRFELTRLGSKGVLTLYLWDGLYPYWFSINGFTLDLDRDNCERVDVKLLSLDKPLEASLARIGVEDYEGAFRGLRDWKDLIVHDERSPIFISRIGGYTVLRLWLPRGVVDSVFLEYIGSSNGVREVDMMLVGRDEFKDYYEVWVKDDVKGYIFRIQADGNTFYFGRDGVDDRAPIVPEEMWGFDRIPWWVGAIYYMIFVDSFERAIESKNVELIKVLEPREHGYYGGDLEGVSRRIDYLKWLGVEALYLTPIYMSASYHRYDVIDHLSIDPIVGGEEAFRNLVEKVRLNGVKLVLDIVAHHTSLCHKYFIELLERGLNRAYKLVEDISRVNENVIRELKTFIEKGCRGRIRPSSASKPFYESFAGTWHMPKLDHYKLHVRRYIKRILSHWLKMGVDGFRFDVGHAIPDSFMKEYYEYLKSLKEDSILISEVTVGVDDYPLGITMDSATNYDLREYLIRFFVLRDIDAYKLAGFIARQYSKIPVPSALSLLNIAGSHDTPRIKTIALNCYHSCVKRIYFALFTLPGAPAIYYGDEIGMEGGGDPDCRRPMIWDENRWDKELLSYIRNLIKARARLKALKYGALRVKALDGDTIAVLRSYDGEHVLGVVTRNDQVRSLDLGSIVVKEVIIGSIRDASILLEDGVTLLTLHEKKGMLF